jgi:hypothetical protein
MTSRPTGLGPPIKPLTGFPHAKVTAERTLYRSTSTTNSPWWFGSDGTQRFDLPESDGTCYLAADIETAIRERGRETLLASGHLSPAFVSSTYVYELRLPSPVTLANTTGPSAVNFGANRELATVTDYTLSCAWAAGFHQAGFNGIAYASRFTSVPYWNAIALFGRAGEAKWAILRKLEGGEAVREAGMDGMLRRTPLTSQAEVVPPPPPRPRRPRTRG